MTSDPDDGGAPDEHAVAVDADDDAGHRAAARPREAHEDIGDSPWVAGRSSVAPPRSASSTRTRACTTSRPRAASSATSSSADQPACDREASSAASVSTTPPVVATGRPPHRSTAMPTSGRQREHAEDVHRDDEADDLQLGVRRGFMWIGVITMTATMTRWPSAMTSIAEARAGVGPHHRDAPRASSRRGPRRRRGSPLAGRRRARRRTVLDRVAARAATTLRAGSVCRRPRPPLGALECPRREQRVRPQQPVDDEPRRAAKPASEKTNEPASSGRPSARATADPGPMRLGPSTEPIVVAQTTIERSRPRCAGCARSAAAYRAWLLARRATPEEEHADERRAGSGAPPRR